MPTAWQEGQCLQSGVSGGRQDGTGEDMGRHPGSYRQTTVGLFAFTVSEVEIQAGFSAEECQHLTYAWKDFLRPLCVGAKTEAGRCVGVGSGKGEWWLGLQGESTLGRPGGVLEFRSCVLTSELEHHLFHRIFPLLSTRSLSLCLLAPSNSGGVDGMRNGVSLIGGKCAGFREDLLLRIMEAR